MKIALITAMDSEYDEINSLYPFRIQDGDATTQVGAKTLILKKCGMGKVNAAIAADRLCQKGVELIMSVGLAGGLDPSLNQGDIVLSTRVCYHDVWCGEPCQFGQVQELPLFFETPMSDKIHLTDLTGKKGMIVTGDQFVTETAELNRIKKLFPKAIALDMESAAIAQVCFLNHIPFLSFRMISDVVGHGQQAEMYRDFWKNCPRKLAHCCQMVIDQIP